MIKVEEVSYYYAMGRQRGVAALREVSLDVQRGEVLGLVGPTGSGKTTLALHLNGLLRPASGRVLVDGEDTRGPCSNVRQIRRKVGLVFQYPEQQIFCESVKEEIGYALRNFRLSMEQERIDRVLELVDLDVASVIQRSPLELSYGEQRRVAIASILVFDPDAVVLDEPTAGLDSLGRDLIAELIGRLRDRGKAVVLISHDLDLVFSVSTYVVVLNQGRSIARGTPREVLCSKALEDAGLGLPSIPSLMATLAGRGWPVTIAALTPEEAAESILHALEGSSHL